MKAAPVLGLNVVCRGCGRAASVTQQALRSADMRTIRLRLAGLYCHVCGSRRFDAWVADGDGRQLIDADRARVCPRCELPRLLPEIDAHPNATLCPACIEEMKDEGERPEAWPMPPPGFEKCPRCGRPAIVREPRDAPGAYFLGCTGFPGCMWHRDMP